MKVGWRGLTVELDWRDAQWHSINRAKSKTFVEFFTTPIASLHGSLLVSVSAVNFGWGELA